VGGPSAGRGGDRGARDRLAVVRVGDDAADEAARDVLEAIGGVRVEEALEERELEGVVAAAFSMPMPALRPSPGLAGLLP
jgi:hypothetical protein